MEDEFDTPDDPMCGKPWADHSRTGDCPRPPADRRADLWIGLIVATVVVVYIAALIVGHRY
jgi:hypothetical protein